MSKRDSNSPLGTIVVVLIVMLATSVALIAGLVARPTGGIALPKGYHVVHITLSEYRISSPQSLPRGNYEFVVTNRGASPHELVMWSTKDRATALPLGKDGDVDEESGALSGVVDSGSSLARGESRVLYADLTTAGHYVLVCNLSGHYRLGMHTNLTVT